jgi:hypothetical protein
VAPVLAVARAERLPSVPVSPGDWETVARLVARLVAVPAARELEPVLRWQLRALERAVAGRATALLPLGRGWSGDCPPPAVEAWRHDRALRDELAEVAIWMAADAACALVTGAAGDVAGAEVAAGAWAEG